MVENPQPDREKINKEDHIKARLYQTLLPIKTYFRDIDNLAKMMQEGMDHLGTHTYRPRHGQS